MIINIIEIYLIYREETRDKLKNCVRMCGFIMRYIYIYIYSITCTRIDYIRYTRHSMLEGYNIKKICL